MSRVEDVWREYEMRAQEHDRVFTRERNRACAKAALADAIERRPRLVEQMNAVNRAHNEIEALPETVTWEARDGLKKAEARLQQDLNDLDSNCACYRKELAQ